MSIYTSIMEKVHEAFLLVRKPPYNVFISLSEKDKRILLSELGVLEDIELKKLGSVPVTGVIPGRSSSVLAQDEGGVVIYERFI